MSEHRYEIRISESCVDPNPLMAERQDPDNFPRFLTRERCALEIAAYSSNQYVCVKVQQVQRNYQLRNHAGMRLTSLTAEVNC